MKKVIGAIVGGIVIGGVIYYGWRRYQASARVRNLHLTTDDLHYSNRTPEDLVSHHLLDLNGAAGEQLSELGLTPESIERLVENRPYRNKLELVSRMILSDGEYSAIKDKVSVAKGGEPVKTA